MASTMIYKLDLRSSIATDTLLQRSPTICFCLLLQTMEVVTRECAADGFDTNMTYRILRIPTVRRQINNFPELLPVALT